MEKLFIICGHGAGDSGAVGSGYTEAERVRALGKRIKELGGDSVMLGDVKRNFYRDKGILNLNISKDYKIAELHMDSGAAGAKGAHIIIKDGFKADAYDNALAKFLGDMFPGRSKKIVGRSDLANVNRAAKKGYNYRLIECGFISNAVDVKIFNENLDKIARGILAAFGIGAGNAGAVTPTPPPAKPIKPVNNKINVDGSWGQATTKALQKIFGTTQDGIVSNQPTINRKYLYSASSTSWQFKKTGYDAGSNVIRALQKLINATNDGWFGKNSVIALQKFLKVKADGSMGPATVRALQQYINSRL